MLAGALAPIETLTAPRPPFHSRSGLWAIKAKNGGSFPTQEKKEKAAKEPTKAPQFYTADDVKKPLVRKFVRKPTKLRKSITPGTVLILLAGRFKGKRVVFLGQLPSGLLLVTGPFKVNGVPLRRVNQAFVIATSLKLDVSGVDYSAVSDATFKSAEKKTWTGRKTEAAFFDDAPKKTELPKDFIANQKKIDRAILSAIKDDTVKSYLATSFSLQQGDRPHLMKF